MDYETIGDTKIPKIGFGTWTIGGRNAPDPAVEERSLSALHSALELGYTHFDTAENYADGHAEELLGRAIHDQRIARESLFITSKVSPEHLGYIDVLSCCENSLRRLRMDYLDLYLIHWPFRGMKLEQTFQALNKLVKDGKVLNLGVSNFKLSLLKQAVALAETHLLTDQVPYSLFDRAYANNGVLEFCQNNNILVTAYSPVKSRNTMRSQTLNSIANAKGITAQQAALAWLILQPHMITIPMSFNPQHQAENLKAADIAFSEKEIDRLNNILYFQSL